MEKKKKNILVVSFQSLSANSGAGMARLGFYLSKELQKRGLLKKFIVYSKGKYETPFPSEPVSRLSRYFLLILNTINKTVGLKPHRFRFLQEQLFDWFCSFKVNRGTGLLFVTHPFLKRTFTKAKRLGIVIVLLPGTPEENYIYQIVTEENKKLGITHIDAYTYKKRLNYFNDSISKIDVVIGSLPPAYSSYKASKVFNGRTIELTGHMPPDFKPVTLTPKDPNKESFKVGYIAHTVVLKGLQYLLEAWEDIVATKGHEHMELQIVGNIDESIAGYIHKRFANIKQVKFLGHMNNVQDFVKELDLFVVPSLIDGGPVTALEAAHYAVPVLITEGAGSAELLSRGKGGCKVVPIKDAAALKENILWANDNRAESIQMGLNGKENLTNHSFEDFMVRLADQLETITA